MLLACFQILYVVYPLQAGDKIFSQVVDASKDMATVKQARRTMTSTNFVLFPNIRSGYDELSSDDAEVIQKSTEKDGLFRLDELQELRSKESLPSSDKSSNK